MPNSFAVLQFPSRPWLLPEELQTRFLELAAKWHPDGNSDPNSTAEFQKITVAHQTLKDPVRRIEAVLELERPGFVASLAKNAIPSSLPELFMEIATLQREINAFCAQHSSTHSPLSLALLKGEVIALRKDLEQLDQKLRLHWERCLNQIQAADSTWERRTTESLTALALVHQEMVYLQRWREQLKESRVRLDSLQ